jgi:hypothetical protein
MGRGTSGKVVQIGAETTPGTQVAANKAPTAFSWNLRFEKNVTDYTAQGYNFTTVSALQRAWMGGDLNGPFSFNEIIYPLSSLFGAPTPTTPSGGTNARTWAFLPAPRGASTIKTYTVEQGDSTAARIATHVAVRSLDFDFGTDEITVSGGLLGRTATSGVLTSSPTSLAQIIGSVNQIDVYMAAAGGLATLFDPGNKITDAIDERFSIGEKLDPRFVHNTTYQSFKDLIEKRPDLDFSFTTEDNAQSRTLYDAAVGNVFKYLGLKITGPIIEGAIPYEFRLTVAANVTPNEEVDAGGVWGYSYSGKPQYDSTLGSAFKIEVTNIMTAL